ncbi:uncharacterized protein F5891DRAFT_981481 [Suillus fuscotomentosus]|uniref:Uncharacterized protein n=1 Tax=Suillus fuscotomentosus TaxID=1912939 RepID=A0AAD4E315_9AGAM|nr:uncharacterized protein F5891DRAFT_981480 [Suillus fuscotomentosus]XP_041224385.1 uncharacterized protein F5891DRAFT_981481 [Suillus fuscotomentosus]KAG1898808.1 hypothetical protein F5891DRAFT_981480 [Suillus fuscotomentosus]KAG1898809.1 hypothetical protein F5891DRAFT_981481 [Suillus fuscotomentosus]
MQLTFLATAKQVIKMTEKAKAALEEQTIRTLSKKHKNNSSRDSGNMNLKKAKKTLLPGNTPTNGAGSMDEDKPVNKNRPVTALLSSCPELISSQQAVVHTEEEENTLYKDDEMAEDKLWMMDEVCDEDRFVDEAELLNERVWIQPVKLVLVEVCKLA